MHISYYITYYILPIDCLSIAQTHDMSQGMGQGMPMAWAKTWALLEAVGAAVKGSF